MVKPRNSLHNLKVCEHGGIKKPMGGDLIDFSASLNPYGPPEFIFDAIKEASNQIGIYPDSESGELRLAISKRIQCSKDEVLAGSGVSELIRLLALSFVKDRVLIPKYTYGEYEPAAKMLGASILKIEMPDLIIDPLIIEKKIKKDDVIFLCNPNNPTGQNLKETEIKKIVECAEDKDALLVIDEAYVDFVEDTFDLTEMAINSDNLILLRSQTKAYSIPGIRLGYLTGSKKNVKTIGKVKPPWNVSTIAQAVGVVIMEDETFLDESVKRIFKSKKIIEQRLDVESDSNFYILNVKNAKKAKEELMDLGVLVRDCTSFGLPFHIRFSVRGDKENEALLEALYSAGNKRN